MSAPAMAVLALTLAGAALLVIAELSTVIEIRVGDVVREAYSGGQRHGWALLVLAIAALPLGWLATVRGSRPAGLGLAGLGLAALVFWGAGDLPDIDEVGEFGLRYEAASARAASGFWIELAGALALVVAGLLAPLTARARRADNQP